jgi:3'-phosphoadenosine 5'-phosphosulfate sulfotransferase (PAPS reductase)/FAD synthetase
MDFQLSIEDSTESSKPTGYHKVAEAAIYDQLDKGADLVVSMSGGKDSTATYLHLLEQGVFDRVERAGGTVRRVFADTGWELDETYAYLDVLAARFGPIDRVALWVPGPNEDPPPRLQRAHSGVENRQGR